MMATRKKQKKHVKTIIVHILRVLYAYTSPEHTATQTAIVHYLNDIGIPCCRKTVKRNIDYLVGMGIPILRKEGRNGGYYYDSDNDNFFVREIRKGNEKK